MKKSLRNSPEFEQTFITASGISLPDQHITTIHQRVTADDSVVNPLMHGFYSDLGDYTEQNKNVSLILGIQRH